MSVCVCVCVWMRESGDGESHYHNYFTLKVSLHLFTEHIPYNTKVLSDDIGDSKI